MMSFLFLLFCFDYESEQVFFSLGVSCVEENGLCAVVDNTLRFVMKKNVRIDVVEHLFQF